MIRDPNSADPNAQAPEGHPDAQVRVDQTVKLTGVQPTKYPLPPEPAPATEGNAQPQAEAGGEEEAPPVPVSEDAPPAEPVQADPVPAGEVTPDAEPQA